MDDKCTLCTLTEVEKRYGKSTVLSVDALSVFEGEILGVKGANGAGKSTLLGVMAGTLRPDSGRILYAPGVRGQIGYIPQELSLYSSLAGTENLRFWGLACGLPSRIIHARSEWLLKELGLTKVGGQKVDSYSGGMKRRLHLATALMVTPRLLLLDEPTVGADVHSVEMILAMLLRLRGQGCGIVLISHQDKELEQVCDRVLLLDKGVPVLGEGI